MSAVDQNSGIRLFLAVCDLGSFAAAAARQGLSASAVAKAISRLEQRLAVSLFHRTTRRMALTREGAAYRDVCRNVLAALEAVEADLRGDGAEPAGRLRLSLPPLLGAEVLAPALFQLADAHPQLAFDITLDDEKVDLVAEGVDLAVRVGTIEHEANLTARRLGTQRVVLCCSAGYLKGRKAPQEVENLSGHALLANLRGDQSRPWMLRAKDGQFHAYIPSARIRTQGAPLLLQAVRQGRGIGLLPEWLVSQQLASGELVPVLRNHIGGHLPIYAVWPTTRRVLPRMRVAIDTLTETIASNHGLSVSGS